jgi:arylsulfatase A-like enzyme
MHLGFAALAAAFVGALVDAGVILSRAPHCSLSQIVAAVCGGLLAFSALGIALGLIALVAGRLFPPERAAGIAGRPALFFVDLWNGARSGMPDPGLQPQAPWAWLAGKAAALTLLAAVIFFTLSRFHDAGRIAVAAACVGLPIALGVDRAVRFGVSAVVALVFRIWKPPLHPRWRVAGRKASCGLLVAGLTAPLVWVAVERERLFGAVDPSALVVLASAAAAGSVVCALLFSRRARGGIGRVARPWRVIAAGATSLVTGVILVSASPPARQTLAARGALSVEILALLQVALDADRDRSAWLIGGDCHPFDPHAHPLAIERPGNGYDENCDGSDQAVSLLGPRDPLDSLSAPTRLVRKGGNVLVLLIDAASPSHLSLYGAARATTPNLDKFAKRCAVFDNFFAASNHTALSMPALLTGLPPSAFRGAAKRSFSAVQLSGAQLQESLQRRFSAAGYETRMIAGHRMGGFTRGFDKLEKPEKERTPASLLEVQLVAALRELTPRPARPALVFAHYMDAHHPYEAPENPIRFGESPRDRYDSELRYVDDHLSRALALSGEEGFRDWLVVVTSDHGEAFGEHQTRYHGESLYDEEIRVPLVIRAPGASARRIATPAGHLDILPTILEWAGLPRDPALSGRSLLGLLAADAEPPGRRVVFSEFFRKGIQVSAHDGRYALAYNLDADVYELYDGRTDPGQRDNLYGEIDDAPLEAALKAHAAATLQRLDANARPVYKPPKKGP